MNSPRFAWMAICAAALTVLTACGGGGNDSGTPVTPAPPPSTAGSADYNVRTFSYTDPDNYTLHYYYSANVADTTGLFPYSDLRTGLAGGAPVPLSTLYDTAVYASPTGWLASDGSSVNYSTGGTSATLYQGGYEYTSQRTDTNVAGMSIGDAVKRTQDLLINTVSTVIGLDPAGLDNLMPLGAQTRLYRLTLVKAPVRYRVSEGVVPAAATFPDLVAAYPPTVSPTASNTVSMGRLHPNGCGASLCAAEALRVTFGGPGVANFYFCDYAPAGAVYSNCVAAGNGHYSLDTAEDGLTPIMRFSGLPTAASVQSFTRVFVNRGGVIYYGWQDKVGAVTVTTRLNRVAFEALVPQLGIAAPGVTATPSVYAGNWSASYNGGDAGSCPSIVIDALGNIQGSCVSSVAGGIFTVSGIVMASGAASFSVGGGTSSAATFTGSFTASSGSGPWSWPSRAATGTWVATKN